MIFQGKLDQIIQKNNSLVCVGLDPDPQKTPASTIFEFNKNVVDLTSSYVAAYKPNIAFYEAQGLEGLSALKQTIEYLQDVHPGIPIILDAKRSDIGHTSTAYAKAVFGWWEADAITINAYCGLDSIEPFLAYEDKGIFVLCRTSNQGAGDFQDLEIDGAALYKQVAKKVVQWSGKYKNLAMVVGATWPQQMKEVREIAPEMTFLVPGIGAQGGDLEGTLENGLRAEGKGLIISSSRGIIYDQDPKAAAQKLRDEINKYR